MKLNLFALQKHTEKKKTRELTLDVQHRKSVTIGDSFLVQNKNFVAFKLRNTKHPFTVDVICMEITSPGNPELIKYL